MHCPERCGLTCGLRSVDRARTARERWLWPTLSEPRRGEEGGKLCVYYMEREQTGEGGRGRACERA